MRFQTKLNRLFAGKTCRAVSNSVAPLSAIRIVAVDRNAEELEAALKRYIQRDSVLALPR